MSVTAHNLNVPQQRVALFTNHAHVLVLIAQQTDIRMREIAATIGITERAVQRIVDDLTNGGYITVTKDGRRNRYEIRKDHPIGHWFDQHRTLSNLVQIVFPPIAMP